MKKWLVFSIFFVSTNVCFGLTLSDIRSQVRIHIKDNGSRLRFSNSQLNNFINQTQNDVINTTWAIKKSTSIELTTQTTYYSLPTDFIEFKRVTFEDRNLPQTSMTQLDNEFNNSSWELTSGFPKQYFENPAQPNNIGIFPFPDSASSTGTLRVEYFSEVDDMTSDSDTPYNGNEDLTAYHELLIYDPVYKVLIMEGQTNQAQQYRQYFENRLLLMIRLIGQRPNYNPGFTGARSP